jgi:hypothetical protein
MSDVADFTVVITNWIGSTIDKLETIYRNSAVVLFDFIIDDNPVDITEPDDVVSKGDWTFSVDNEPSDVNRNDPSGEQAKEELRSTVRSWKPSNGQTLFGGNFKPYIRLLEYGGYPHSDKSDRTTADGHSNQAPYGMAGINVNRWEDIVEIERAKLVV